ncbi:MAG: CCA tRNA nucleotidyltransferase [Planctomycetota bacterium]
MASEQPNANTPERNAATHVARVLQDAGHTAYFAGGCVRDELLGLSPKDYDVATDATPEQVGTLFRSTAHVGAHFGVVVVRLSKGDRIGLADPVQIEVATFRSDGSYTDGRRPDSVRFATEAEDAQRRDFTINALFLDPIAPADGESIHGHIIDHVGGIRDLRASTVRAVGNPADRLREDHLRALRAVRFAANLGFVIERGTSEAVRDQAAMLAGVSTERIGDEIRRMLAHPSRADAVTLMREHGLEAAAVGKPPENDLTRLGSLPADAGIPTALAAWALDRGDRGVTFRDRLCLSNAHAQACAAIMDLVDRFRYDWDSLGVAQRKRLAASRAFLPAIEVFAGPDPIKAQTIAANRDALDATPSGLTPTPLLTGGDLIAAGYRPGPLFSIALDRAYDAQLEDRASDKDRCLAIVRAILDTGPQGPPSCPQDRESNPGGNR